MCVLFTRVVAIGCPTPLPFRQSRPTSLAGSRRVRLHSVTTFPRAPRTTLASPRELYRAENLPAFVTSLVDTDSVPFADICLLLSGEFHSFLLLLRVVAPRSVREAPQHCIPAESSGKGRALLRVPTAFRERTRLLLRPFRKQGKAASNWIFQRPTGVQNRPFLWGISVT